MSVCGIQRQTCFLHWKWEVHFLQHTEGEQIPTLEEMLACARGPDHINDRIKIHRAGAGTGGNVLALLAGV